VSSYEKPSMTLAEVINLAQIICAAEVGETTTRAALARGILDLLEADSECMIEPPEIVHERLSDGSSVIGIKVFEEGDSLTRGEARAYAAMILHQCDKADGR
jgi:hypothetical protein